MRSSRPLRRHAASAAVLFAIAACGSAAHGQGPASRPGPADPAPKPAWAGNDPPAGQGGVAPAAPATPAKPATAGPAGPLDPVRERAAGLREAASLLEKAAAALERGNRNLAEQLFSSAEIITGPQAVADQAGLFRAGAPPRMDTPLEQMTDDAHQPEAVGSSEEDEPAARPQRASLSGSIQIDGKNTGALGVVTLEPLGKKWKPRTPKRRIMEQRDRTFAPHVMAISVGSTVVFPNFDATFHNVFSISPAASFDLGLYRNGEAREVAFHKEGIVRIGCNLHANMSAYVVVVGAPHFVIADRNGEFTFHGLAPGKYRIKAWTERSREATEQTVTIVPGPNQVTIGAAGDAPQGMMPDKFGAARGGKS